MKILMITPYVPYPTSSGGQIRTFNLLRYLSKRNEITLVCLYKLDREKDYQSHLKPFCKQIFFCRRPEKPWQLRTIFDSLFSERPFLVSRNSSDEAREILKKLFREQIFDVIHVETFYVMPHIPKVKTPILLVEQTIEYKVYQHFVDTLPFFIRPLFLTDIVKLNRSERFYWNKAHLVATVSESDKKAITAVEPEIKPVIVPNGAGDEMIAKKLIQKNLKNPVLLFQGNFLWLQNTEAANYLIEKIYPLLKKQIKGFKLLIAGQFASKKINKSTDKNIEIVDINVDQIKQVKEIYQESTLFIAPIFGPGGTRLKILAAMANGLPIVSTKTGVEGLEVRNNHEVLIATTPQEFADKIVFILKNKKLYEKIRLNAYQLIDKYYNWEKIAQNLEIIYEKLIKT